MEHRWGHRIPVDIGVRLSFASNVVAVGRLRQVSISGAFLRTAAELPLMTPIQLTGLTTASLAACEPLDAYVARRIPSGFALEWADLAPVELEPFLAAAGVRLAPEIIQRPIGLRAVRPASI
jgi:hypothetical protein